jgi:hypothetical protein
MRGSDFVDSIDAGESPSVAPQNSEGVRMGKLAPANPAFQHHMKRSISCPASRTAMSFCRAAPMLPAAGRQGACLSACASAP